MESQRLQANLDAYSLLQAVLIYNEQPLFLLVLRGLRIHHLILWAEYKILRLNVIQISNNE